MTDEPVDVPVTDQAAVTDEAEEVKMDVPTSDKPADVLPPITEDPGAKS